MNIWKITIKIHPKIFLISLPRHSRNRKDFLKIERLLHEKKFDFWLIKRDLASPTSIWISYLEGENGKIRLRKRSNVQGLTHLTLFLPFQLNGSKKTDNRRRKPRHSPTTTRDGFRSMDHAVGYRTSILSSEFLSLAHLFSHVCIGMDGSVHRVMQYWRVWRHANVFVI